MSFKSFSIFFFLMTVIMLNSCRKDPSNGTVVIVAKDEFDAEDQKKIGLKLNEVIADPMNEFEILDGAEYAVVNEHLNTLMKMIVNTEPVVRRTQFDWQVSVLKDDNMETAFMTPGGHLYIYTGLLKYLDGEHELLGVMAHEIGYADNDNLVRRIKNEFGSKDLSKILSELNDSDQIALDMAHQLNDMQFSEAEVLASDEFSVSIVCEFGWDAAGLSHLLTRAESDSPQVEWIERKPIFADRIQNIESMIGMGTTDVCGKPEMTYHERYMEKIVNRLP